MSHQDADRIALRYHAALAAVRAGQGERMYLQRPLQMTVLASFMGDAYAAALCPDAIGKFEQCLLQAVSRGEETDVWTLDEGTIELCAAIATHHDYQLRTAPRAAVNDATQRLDRFLSDQSYDRANPNWRCKK
ncbi:hypothetical protein WT83_04930 [Burkholderia territorii]|uniref:Fis family transcriptional regulator n=1 Tax=Burkholderia territorii TaxID=1503055 RepID=A0A108F2S5_9BURK|nr:hypothetical protein [Burkholderia territorii]KWN22018.1 hypothetical protein WT83_04930 [Burkholderia territorii]